MASIKEYVSTSKLPILKVKYGGEEFVIDLAKEVRIRESLLNKEALIQPSNYAFIAILHKKIAALASKQETLCKRLYSKAYLKWRQKKNDSTGRPYPDDFCKEKAILDKDYQSAEDHLNNLREKESLLWVAVKAFEQRQSLIQTISANERKNLN